MHNRRNSQGGYVALMSTIVISLVLLVLISQEAFSGWYTRFTVLGTEAKEQASALAEGCSDQALTRVITDVTGTWAQTGVDIAMPNGEGTCHIYPVQFNSPPGHVTVKTQAVVRGSYANLSLAQDFQDIHTGTPASQTSGVIIVQTVVNNNGTNKNPGDFTMHVSGSGATSQSGTCAGNSCAFPGSSTGVVVAVAAGATYSVSEDPLSGFSQIFSGQCSGTVPGGQVRTCTVTNTTITTTLTVIANVTNLYGIVNNVPGDFPLQIDGTSATLGNSYTVAAGVHNVSATTLTGYSASSWGYDCAASGAVTLNQGDHKICIINFADNPPPAPSCADTVMILDRTGSMTSTDLSNEGAAALALKSLYAGVLPPLAAPRLGVGSIGAYPNQSLPGGAAGIPTLGQLSTNYANLTSIINSITGSNSSVGSDLSAGISAAAAELNGPRHLAGNQKVLILVSDGDPNQPSGTNSFNTGFAFPTANSQNAASDLWSNPANAYSDTDGGADASDVISGGNRHRFFNFGFGSGSGLPAGSTVTGIEVQADAWNTAAGGVAGTSANLAPSGTGISADWAPSSGTITAAVTSSDTTYITPTPQQQTFAFAGAAIPSGATVTSVTLHVLALGSGSTMQLMEENGSTQVIDPSVRSLTGSYVDYSFSFPTMPNGSAWTASEVNAWTTRFGAQNNTGTNARIDRMYVVVGYTTGAPGSSGPNTATASATASSGFGSVAWTNTTNARVTDSAYATAALTTSSRFSQLLQLTGYGFSIPSNATVTGIQVSVRRSGTVANVMRDEVAQLIKAGATTGIDQAGGSTYNISTTDTTVTFGNSTDLWGTTWTPSQINASNFGFAYEMGHSTSGASATARVDSMTITVFYTTPSPGTSANLAPSGTGISADWAPSSGTITAAVTSSDTTYITPTPQQQTFAFAGAAIPSGATVTSVTLHVLALGSGSTMQLMEENGSTQVIDPSVRSLTGSYVDYSFSFPTMPNGSAWTASEVNAWTTRFGAQNNTGTNARIDRMYVVVGYTTPPACQLGVDLSWNAGTNWSSEKTQVLTGTNASYLLGSSGDKWGTHTWVPTDFSNANFRSRVHAINPGGSCSASAIDHLDALQVRVYYTQTVDPIAAALNAADAAKAANINLFTIHFGSDPGPYQGIKLLANIASGTSPVSYNGVTHQTGSLAQAGGVTSNDTGYIPATAVATPSQWTNATKAFSSDNQYATDAVNGHQQGFNTFNFAIPPTATINGIALSVEAKSTDTSGCQVGAEISSNNGGSFTTTGTNAGVTGSDVAYTLGGAASLWGRAWTPADFANGNFAVRLQNIDPGNACINGSTLSVDQIRARVYYTVNTENSDNDNFFISPTSADMKDIFNFIGNQVCPAASNPAQTPPPTQAAILTVTHTINNEPPPNTGTAASTDFTASASGNNISPASFAGSESGVIVTMNPGTYAISGSSKNGYTQSTTPTCDSGNGGAIVAGETRVCVITNDDIPPPPPPPNLNLTPGTIQETP